MHWQIFAQRTLKAEIIRIHAVEEMSWKCRIIKMSIKSQNNTKKNVKVIVNAVRSGNTHRGNSPKETHSAQPPRPGQIRFHIPTSHTHTRERGDREVEWGTDTFVETFLTSDYFISLTVFTPEVKHKEIFSLVLRPRCGGSTPPSPHTPTHTPPPPSC